MKTWFSNKIIYLYLFFIIGCLSLLNTAMVAQERVQVTLIKDMKLSETTKLTFFNFKDAENPKPKIEVYDQKIIFYNEGGEVIATRIYDEPIVVDHSENEQFFKVGSTKQYPNNAQAGLYKIDFYNSRGKRLFSKTLTGLSEDLPPSEFRISNNGAIVELNSVDGNLVFYDKSGHMLKKVNFYQFSDRGTALSGRFSNSGNLVLVGINYPQVKANSEIILYDVRGNEKWRFKSKQRNVFSRLFISPEERYAVSTHYNHPKYEKKKTKKATGPENLTTYILNANTGAIISEHPNIHVREVLFFQLNSRDYALINDVGDRVAYVNLANGRVENTYSLPSDEEILGMDVDVLTQNIAMVKSKIEYIKLPRRGYRRTFSQPQLEIFDLKGNLISRQSLPVPQLKEHLLNNKLKFLDNGSKLMIHLKSGKKLMVFTINN